MRHAKVPTVLALCVVLAGLGGCLDRGEPSGLQTTADAAAETEMTPEARYQDFMQLGLRMSAQNKAQEAARAFRQALSVREEHFGLDDPGSGNAMIHMALELSAQRRYDEAELAFARADPIMRVSSAKPDYPRFLSYKAAHKMRLKEFALALETASQGNALREPLVSAARGGGGTTSATQAAGGNAILMADHAFGLMVEAAALYRLNEFDRAEDRAFAARAVIGEVPAAPRWWYAKLDDLIGLIEANRQRFVPAVERVSRAAVIKQKALGRTRPSAESLLTLGRVHQLEGSFATAMETMREGIRIALQEGRRGFRHEQVATFINAALSQGEREPADAKVLLEEAFLIGQMRWGGAAAQTIAQTALRLAEGEGPSARAIAEMLRADREFDDLRLQLGRLVAKPKKARDPQLINEIKVKVKAAQDVQRAARKQAQELAPDFIKLLSNEPITPKRLSDLMAPDEALVSFLTDIEDSFAFVVRGGRVTVRRLELDLPVIADAVDQLRSAFDIKTGGIQVYDTQLAYALYQALLGPFATELAGVRHLIAVPDKSLLSLPFGLLVTSPPPPGEQYAAADWLIRDMAISVLPSVRGFADLRALAKPSRAPNPLVAFGNPVFEGDAGGLANLAGHCGTGQAIPPSLVRGLAPLPDTETEVLRVADSMNADRRKVFLANQVTETNIRNLPLDQYRVLYFATHGLLPGELQCENEPALALTAPVQGATTRDNDGLLEASEIAQLSLDANLVVLSACNTGGGDSGHGGESLSGLTEAFFYAGARSLLVSHWPVDSEVTMRMMTDMFSRLSGMDRFELAEAQRQSQLAILNNPGTSHPFFWAPFTVIGDGNPGVIAPPRVNQAAR